MTNTDAFAKTLIEGLFIKPVFTELDDCFKQGQAAGSQFYGRDQNPYPRGEARREWWDSGWSDALDELCGT